MQVWTDEKIRQVEDAVKPPGKNAPAADHCQSHASTVTFYAGGGNGVQK